MESGRGEANNNIMDYKEEVKKMFSEFKKIEGETIKIDDTNYLVSKVNTNFVLLKKLRGKSLIMLGETSLLQRWGIEKGKLGYYYYENAGYFNAKRKFVAVEPKMVKSKNTSDKKKKAGVKGLSGKENVKIAFTKLFTKDGNVYTKTVRLSPRLWKTILGKMASENPKNSYEQFYIKSKIAKEGNVYFPNLTQADYLQKYIKKSNVDVNEKRLLTKKNTAFIVE